MTPRLPTASLRYGRRLAKAQVSDPQILATLRAKAREAVDDPEALGFVLLSLQSIHAADVEDLDDFRALGRSTIQLIIYAAAVGEHLNAQFEAYEGDVTSDEAMAAEGYRAVTGAAASMCMFMGRTFLALDPTELAGDIEKDVRKMADMSPAQLREKVEQLRAAVNAGAEKAGAA